MARTYTPRDLVALPRLSAAEMLALIVSLEKAAEQAAARGSKLPEHPAEALSTMRVARQALQRARVERRQKMAGKVDPLRARTADIRIDHGWAALAAWTGCWGRIDEQFASDDTRACAAMHEALFGEGLDFLALKYPAEWAESQAHLDQIKEAGYDKLIKKMGGGMFLDAVRALHSEYGEAIGVTQPASQVDGPDDAVRVAQDEAADAVRGYVTELAALARRKDASQRALADTLLVPLTTWKRSAPADVVEPEEPADPSPAAPKGQPVPA